jgi:hypothetical protein
MRLGDGSSVECAFHATEEPSPCRSPEQSSIFSSLFVPGAPGMGVSMKIVHGSQFLVNGHKNIHFTMNYEP